LRAASGQGNGGEQGGEQDSDFHGDGIRKSWGLGDFGRYTGLYKQTQRSIHGGYDTCKDPSVCHTSAS